MARTLYRALRTIAAEHPQAVALVSSLASDTYASLLSASESFAGRLKPFAGQHLGIALAPSSSWIAAAAACDKLGISVALLPPLERETLAAFARAAGVTALVNEDGSVSELHGAAAIAHPPGSVTILTSGTTGVPKPVVHSWRSLFRPVRLHRRFLHGRWLLAYPLYLYAGLQVFGQSLRNAGALHVYLDSDPAELSHRIAEDRIDFISATPSFWRRLLMLGSSEAFRASRLRHITLGGEPVGDELLQRLQKAFPRARLTHIYATSELGRCFAVTDGRAGFPAAYLERAQENGVELRITGAELEVRSSNRALNAPAPSGGWLRTGDLVEIAGDRVRFRGRRNDVINVAGHKVHPAEVESVLREVAGVSEAYVHPIDSALVGSLLGARIAAEPGIDPRSLEAAVRAHCVRRLRPFQRPRILEIVKYVELSAAHKLRRNIAA